MRPKICLCGRTIYGMGKRCRLCQGLHLAERAERADKPARVLRVDEDRHPAHLAWVRLHRCAILECQGRSIAAHVRMNTGGGMGLKPADHWTIPLCNAHHQEQHQIGHTAFDVKYGIDSRALAERLAAESPYLAKESA